MVFSLLTMPLAYYFFRYYLDEPPQIGKAFSYLVGVFVCLGFRRLFQSARFVKKSRFEFLRLLICGIAILLASIGMHMLGNTQSARMISGVYLLILVLDRVLSCFNKPKLSKILLNIILVLVLAALFFDALSSDDVYLLEVLLALFGALLSSLAFVFGRIKVRMLLDIIRQTYAAEIISGLMMLIFVFSFMMMVFEKNITSYGDALWYCFAIVTTIGFGDISAVTIPGRIMSVILGIYGIVVVALITSIIVAFYGEMKKERISGKDEDEEEETLEEFIEENS